MNSGAPTRNIVQRIFGIPATPRPANPDCWSYSQGILHIDLEKAPELQAREGAMRLEGGNLPLRVLVFCDKEGSYHALHNRCSHMGHRRLDPWPENATVHCCSVSKSAFDLKGNNISGPAPEPIRTFPVTPEEGRLSIRLE